MLLAVGVPEVIIANGKTNEYRTERTRLQPPPPASSPTELYPKRTAADEKLAVIEAKLGYYRLLRSAGRFLVLVGVALVGIGALREPPHPIDPAVTTMGESSF